MSDLFKGQYWNLSQPYPKFRILRTELAAASVTGQLNLEEQLRWFATHSNPEVREQFKEIPLYLRDVLAQVSRVYCEYPGTFIHLLQRVLRYEPHRVAIITTNYDTILEQALQLTEPSLAIRTLTDYASRKRRIGLYKLHGSTNWVTPMSGAPPDPSVSISDWWEDRLRSFDATGPLFKRRIDFTNEDSTSSRARSINIPGAGFVPVYPVLTAPLAGKGLNDLVCPREHLDSLMDFLSGCSKFLVAGTSGLDSDVLNILDQGCQGSAPRMIHYVTNDDSVSDAVRDRFHSAIRGWPSAESVEVIGSGFKEYIFGTAYQHLLTA